MNNGVDEKGRTFPKMEARSISSCSSGSYGEAAEDNTLLSSDTCSTTTCSSDGGYCNAALESDLDGEGVARRVLEAALQQPVSSSLRISSSEVHVGPSLTYNGPITINLTMPPQPEGETASRPTTDAPAQPLRSQTTIPQLHQQPKMVSRIQIQSQAEMELPRQQQPVVHPTAPNQIPQPIFKNLEEPSPHLQQPRWKPVICTKQPRSMLQRNIQTANEQDFRTVKPVGCQRIAAELSRRELEDGGVGALSCCDQNLGVVVLFILILSVLGIAVSQVINHELKGTRKTTGSTTTSIPMVTSPYVGKTEKPQESNCGEVHNVTGHKQDMKNCSAAASKTADSLKDTSPNVEKTVKPQERKCGEVPNVNAHRPDTKNCSAAASKTADPQKDAYEPDKTTGKQSTVPCMPYPHSHTDLPHSHATSERPRSERPTTSAPCKCNR